MDVIFPCNVERAAIPFLMFIMIGISLIICLCCMIVVRKCIRHYYLEFKDKNGRSTLTKIVIVGLPTLDNKVVPIDQ